MPGGMPYRCEIGSVMTPAGRRPWRAGNRPSRGVLTGEIAVEGDQRLDGVVIHRCRRRCQRRSYLGHRIRPPVVAADVQRRPRVLRRLRVLARGSVIDAWMVSLRGSK